MHNWDQALSHFENVESHAQCRFACTCSSNAALRDTPDTPRHFQCSESKFVSLHRRLVAASTTRQSVVLSRPGLPEGPVSPNQSFHPTTANQSMRPPVLPQSNSDPAGY